MEKGETVGMGLHVHLFRCSSVCPFFTFLWFLHIYGEGPRALISDMADALHSSWYSPDLIDIWSSLLDSGHFLTSDFSGLFPRILQTAQTSNLVVFNRYDDLLLRFWWVPVIFGLWFFDQFLRILRQTPMWLSSILVRKVITRLPWPDFHLVMLY